MTDDKAHAAMREAAARIAPEIGWSEAEAFDALAAMAAALDDNGGR